VVLFHGGGLTAGTPLQDLDWAEPLAERGFVVLMAGYRLFDPTTGENPWPAQIADARRAMRWIRTHAQEFNADPRRMGAMGHSSGGHLAGLLGTTDPLGETDPHLAGVSSRATCVVTLAGDADLLVPYEDASTTRAFEALFGGTMADRPDVWREASPVHHVDEATVPFLVIHGNRDQAVPIRMARNLAAALAAAGVEHVLAELPADHMEVGSHRTASALWETFLDRQLQPQR
jgi:acetyl esterase/lipase